MADIRALILLNMFYLGFILLIQLNNLNYINAGFICFPARTCTYK